MTARSLLKSILNYLIAVVAPLVTGQVVSYYTGDDFWTEYHMPYYMGFARFTPVGPNVVRDMFTGLQWVADPSEIGGVWGTEGNPTSMTWDEAVQRCNELNYGGHSDWRLPNEKELETLIHYGKKDPAIDDSKFKNCKNDYYWSSSMTQHGCENEFSPDFGIGNKSWTPDKSSERYVRPVRGKYIRLFFNQ